MKKFISLFLAILMLLSVAPLSVSAKIHTGFFGDSGELYFEYDTETKTAIISGSGDIPNYLIGSRPWKNYGIVKHVVIKEGVKSIGENAFKNHDNLETVSLPLSVKKIGASAFKGCANLQKINLYAVTELGKNAFESCKKLENVHFSPYLDEIPEQAFEGCWNLKKIELPFGIKKIGKKAFNNCYYYIKSLIIPNSITSIGESAFNKCNITYLELGKGITDIPANAFSENNLTQLVIPSNIKSIHHDNNGILDTKLDGSFSNNKNLRTVYIDGDTNSIEYIDGRAFMFWYFADVEDEELNRLSVASSVYFFYCKANSLNHGYNEERVYYNHIHTFSDTSDIKPNETCKKKKVVAECTECGIKEISYLDGTAPHKISIETIKESTCSQEGYERAYCSVCDYERYNIGYTSYKHTGLYVTHEAEKPTCTQNGWSEGKSCRDCKTIVTASEIIPATNHAKKYKRNIAATCTKDGYNGSYYCPNCYSYLYDEATVIPALNHKNKTAYSRKATCTVVGYENAYYCPDCKTLLTEGATIIPATGHLNLKNYEKVDSTCTKTGQEAGVRCEDCGSWREGGSTISKKDHAYGEWYIIKEGTCVHHLDTKERKCVDCGATTQQGFTSSNPNHIDDNHDAVCDRCNKNLVWHCLCACHKKDGRGTGWHRFRLFFWKLFKTNKECSCGVTHY